MRARPAVDFVLRGPTQFPIPVYELVLRLRQAYV